MDTKIIQAVISNLIGINKTDMERQEITIANLLVEAGYCEWFGKYNELIRAE